MHQLRLFMRVAALAFTATLPDLKSFTPVEPQPYPNES
jgi:hypothetical protein